MVVLCKREQLGRQARGRARRVVLARLALQLRQLSGAKGDDQRA